MYVCVCAHSLRSCLILCYPIHCIPSGSSVHGSLQERILKWVAMPSSRGSSSPGIELMSPPLQADSLPLSHQGSPILSISSIQSLNSVGPFPNLWTVSRQASLSTPAPSASSNSCPSSQWCHTTISSLLSPSPTAFNFPQHQGFFQWVSSSHQVTKVLEIQLQHQ